MYVARERKSVSPSLRLYTKKPIRDYKYNSNGLWQGGDSIPISPELFPDLKWEDEPLEVDINLTPKPKYYPSIFTVNNCGKKVKFSPGNLFWDGNKFDFEKHQYDYPAEWKPDHVGHFFWSKDADVARAKYYEETNSNRSDRFFAEDNGAIDGYTVLSKYEWEYLFEHSLAKNSSGKIDFIIAGRICAILKPDGFNGITADNYTAKEWASAEATGLVAFPLAGYRNNSGFIYAGTMGNFWSATPYNNDRAYYATFCGSGADSYGNDRNDGFCVRLVSVQ